MRFIERKHNGKLNRGGPPDEQGGPLYWIETTGSWALVDGVLYRDGKSAGEGDYDLPVPGEETRQYRVKTRGKKAERGNRNVRGNANRRPDSPGSQ